MGEHKAAPKSEGVQRVSGKGNGTGTARRAMNEPGDSPDASSMAVVTSA